MHRSALAAAATLSLAGSGIAQCTFTSASLASYGQGCTAVAVPILPSITGNLDVNACTLDLTANAWPSLGTTLLTARVIAIGTQQAGLPIPQLGPGCALLVQPDGVVFLPVAGGGTLSLGLPPILPPLVFHAQAASIYFQSITMATGVNLTPGYTITLN